MPGNYTIVTRWYRGGNGYDGWRGKGNIEKGIENR